MMTMFWIEFFLQAQAIRSKPAGQREGAKNCKDHFDNAGATGINRTPFAALFFRNRISFCWHKCTRQSQEVVSLSWIQFKTFL